MLASGEVLVKWGRRLGVDGQTNWWCVGKCYCSCNCRLADPIFIHYSMFDAVHCPLSYILFAYVWEELGEQLCKGPPQLHPLPPMLWTYH